MKEIKIELIVEGKVKVGGYSVEETLTPAILASLLNGLTEQFGEIEIKGITIK